MTSTFAMEPPFKKARVDPADPEKSEVNSTEAEEGVWGSGHVLAGGGGGDQVLAGGSDQAGRRSRIERSRPGDWARATELTSAIQARSVHKQKRFQDHS